MLNTLKRSDRKSQTFFEKPPFWRFLHAHTYENFLCACTLKPENRHFGPPNFAPNFAQIQNRVQNTKNSARFLPGKAACPEFRFKMAAHEPVRNPIFGVLRLLASWAGDGQKTPKWGFFKKNLGFQI